MVFNNVGREIFLHRWFLPRRVYHDPLTICIYSVFIWPYGSATCSVELEVKKSDTYLVNTGPRTWEKEA